MKERSSLIGFALWRQHSRCSPRGPLAGFAAFEQQNRLILRQFSRDGEADHTSADDHDIVHLAIVHARRVALCYARPMSVRSRRTFQELVTLPDGAIPLAEAALLMACEEYPQLQIGPYLDQLDEMAAAARQRVSDRSEPTDVVGIINDVLFDQFGFRGNDVNYYDPRNSFFNDVLDRR